VLLSGLGTNQTVIHSNEMAWEFDRWARGLRARAHRGAFAAIPHLAASALQIEAGRLRFQGLPQLFAPDLLQIPPTLNEDLLELVGRSEPVLANRFGFFNQWQEFGSEIDWELHPSAAWRAELHAFDHALDLALTYRISREQRYARHLRYLIAQWIAANFPGQGSGWQVHALARRIRNWILAADLARDDWGNDPEFLELVTKSLALQTAFLTWQVNSISNARAALACSRGLLLASRVFRKSESDGLLELSCELLSQVLDDGPDSERFGGSCQPAWQCDVASTLSEFVLFARDQAEELMTWARERFRQSIEALAGMLHADGTLPLFGPEPLPPVDALTDLFAVAAVLLDDPRSKSVAGEFRILPYMLLGESGQSRFQQLSRKDWRAQAWSSRAGISRWSDGRGSSLVIQTSTPASAGEHADYLSFELMIDGQRVVVDSGIFLPPGDGPDNAFACARSHNILLVDDQAPRFPRRLASHPKRWEPAPGVQAVRLLSQAFEFLNLTHERIFLCLEGRCWIVLDHLAGEGCHRCMMPLHFYPIFEVEVAGARAFARSRAAAATVLPIGKGPAALRAHGADLGSFPGWYAPAPGVRYASAVLTLQWDEAPLPWVGGWAISAGIQVDFRPELVLSRPDALTLAFNGLQLVVPVGT